MQTQRQFQPAASTYEEPRKGALKPDEVLTEERFNAAEFWCPFCFRNMLVGTRGPGARLTCLACNTSYILSPGTPDRLATVTRIRLAPTLRIASARQ